MKKKIKEKKQAIELRKEGKSLNEIAEIVNVSKGSISVWVRDVELSEEVEKRLDRKNPGSKNYQGSRKATGRKISETWRKKRRQYQKQGYEEANGDAIHIAGCMLYWAEGAKGKNVVDFCNSDAYAMQFFLRFLRNFYDISDEDIHVSCQITAYTKKNKQEIKKYWLNKLDIAKNSFKKVVMYEREVKNPVHKQGYYGVCSIRVHNTQLVQRIFGAIKKYAGIEDQELWLNGYQ